MFTRIWNHILAVLQKTGEGWQEDDGFLLSAAMAYYAAFSLFPLCLVLISILGFVLRVSQRAGDAQTLLLERVKSLAGGPWLSDQLQVLLAHVKSDAGLNGPLGAMALLAAAIVVFLQLDYMFDRIFGVTKAKTITAWWGYAWSVVYGRLWAFLMLLAVGALLLAPVRGQRHFERSPDQVEGILPGGLVIWGWIHFLFTLATNALLFGVIYKILPKVPVPWRDALTGGLLVSLVWILGQRLLVTFMIGTIHGLRHRRFVHCGDDLALLCQRHPLSRRGVRREPLDRGWPKQKAGKVIARRSWIAYLVTTGPVPLSSPPAGSQREENHLLAGYHVDVMEHCHDLDTSDPLDHRLHDGTGGFK